MKMPTDGVVLMLLLQQLLATIPVLATNVVDPSSRGNQPLTTTGREFVFSFLKLYREHVKLCIYLTNQNAEWTTAVVKVPSVDHQLTSLLERGETRKINLPADSEPLSDDLHNNTIIITANHDISVYGFVYSGESAGGFLVLPTSVLGRDYFVASYQPSRDEWSQFAVTALQDDTSVVIRFRAIVSFRDQLYHPGDRIEKILNKRDSILIKSHEDLTGTQVQSSKPISVVSGVSGAIVPKDMQTKDHMITHLIPVNSWGITFTIPPIPGRRSGYRFRVIASCPVTTIDSPNLQIPVLMKPGDFYECDVQKSVRITSTKPVMVIQYAKSQAYIEGNKPRNDGDGDTLMLVIPPWEMYLTKNITFTGVQLVGAQSFRSYISVTALCSEFPTIKLNGEFIIGSEFYFQRSCTRQTLLSSLISSFTISSANPKSKFLVLVYGAALEISYAYPAGFTLQQTNCDETLSNDASSVSTCCEENDAYKQSSASYSSWSLSNSYSVEEEDSSASSSESDAGPSKPDIQLSSVPLNDSPGSSGNDINPTSNMAEDPAFVVDPNGNSSTCLATECLPRYMLMILIITVLLDHVMI